MHTDFADKAITRNQACTNFKTVLYGKCMLCIGFNFYKNIQSDFGFALFKHPICTFVKQQEYLHLVKTHLVFACNKIS